MLGETCDERIAVGKAADGLELPFPLLDDGSDVRAPIAGVIAGLRAASYHWAVFLPVDAPLVTAEALWVACRSSEWYVPPRSPLVTVGGGIRLVSG